MFKWGLEGYSVSQPNLLKLQPKTVIVKHIMYSRPVSEMRGSALDGVQGAMRLRPACAAAESGADREAPPTPRTCGQRQVALISFLCLGMG